MLIGFLPIFVADTKIIYNCNFIAPLSLHLDLKVTFKLQHDNFLQ